MEGSNVTSFSVQADLSLFPILIALNGNDCSSVSKIFSAAKWHKFLIKIDLTS